jgi:hypothetical protein
MKRFRAWIFSPKRKGDSNMSTTTRLAALTVAITSITTAFAWPACDETTTGSGCTDLAGGGSGAFTLNASWDANSQTQTGTFQYTDSALNFQVSSSALVDYSVLDTGARGFIFQASGANYNEVRVFVADNGGAGDQFEVQLLFNGTMVYDVFGPLTSACGGGVTITSDCGGSTPPPTPQPKPGHPPHPTHVKGNNGVGNGIDPQPPGNPPINDGPGTSPGNPGNRGGAHKK